MKKKIHDFCFRFKTLEKMYKYLSKLKLKVKSYPILTRPIRKYKSNSKKPVFLVFTPEHANLGDHAIAYAEHLMLSKIGVEYFEITGAQLYMLESISKLNILNHATILVNGGGNLGTLWPEIERMNRVLIQANSDSKIVILPNSIYYGINDKTEFEESRKIYNNHNNLYLYAREEISYDIMKEAYKNVKLIPDMVLSLKIDHYNKKRNGCLICLRDDVEGGVTSEEQEKIIFELHKEFKENISFSNTVLDHNVSVTERTRELGKIFDEFSSFELVVTDRLHGMIFCAITGTKCVVLNGKSPKIKGCYQWIKNLGYIKLLENVDDILIDYKNLSSYPNEYKNDYILDQMNELEKDIIQILQKPF